MDFSSRLSFARQLTYLHTFLGRVVNNLLRELFDDEADDVLTLNNFA
jgi:hypothetical protein